MLLDTVKGMKKLNPKKIISLGLRNENNVPSLEINIEGLNRPFIVIYKGDFDALRIDVPAYILELNYTIPVEQREASIVDGNITLEGLFYSVVF